MTDTLATLIKLSAQKVEKVQVRLAAAQRQMNEIRTAQQSWKSELAKANQTGLDGLTNSDTEAMKHAEMFGRRVDNELAILGKIEAAVQENIKAVMATLSTLFAEQKRYEILHEQKLLLERKKHAKKTQGELDEVSGQKKRN